ncbi:hypothetical protein GCM10010383_21900 [Streptomyces lomondensis]|uniref:Uncharacterized protein n=1 Tax=Streptomyces lomondensis TaxID=68229 RepID=A0ABQ2X1F9_9ACTN|nr:hypothetical protein GCM10010383_21900 [Streptomyces lomondensis]
MEGTTRRSSPAGVWPAVAPPGPSDGVRPLTHTARTVILGVGRCARTRAVPGTFAALAAVTGAHSSRVIGAHRSRVTGQHGSRAAGARCDRPPPHDS